MTFSRIPSLMLAQFQRRLTRSRWVIIDPLASHLVCTKSLPEFYWSGWNCFFIDHYEEPIHLIVMSLSMNGFERRENELSSN